MTQKANFKDNGHYGNPLQCLLKLALKNKAISIPIALPLESGLGDISNTVESPRVSLSGWNRVY